MVPLKIHLDNCNELINDARRRVLSSEARKWAEAGFKPRTKWREPDNYFLGIIALHEREYWMDAYRKRKSRLERMKNAIQR